MAESGMAARRFRANRALDGTPCAACGGLLALGEEVAQCNQCQTVEHARCWDAAGGCSRPDCENRPLAPLQPQAGPAPGYPSPGQAPGYPPVQQAPGYPPVQQAPGYPYPAPNQPGLAYPPTGYPGGPGQPTAPAGMAPQPPPPGFKQCPHCFRYINQFDQVCVFCNGITTPDGLYHGPVINAPGATAALTWAIVGFFVCGIILGPIAISKANEAQRAIEMNPMYGGHGLITAAKIIAIIDIVVFVLVALVRIAGS